MITKQVLVRQLRVTLLLSARATTICNKSGSGSSGNNVQIKANLAVDNNKSILAAATPKKGSINSINNTNSESWRMLPLTVSSLASGEVSIFGLLAADTLCFALQQEQVTLILSLSSNVRP